MNRWNRWGRSPCLTLSRPRLPGMQTHPSLRRKMPPSAHLYRGCSDVSEGDRSGMERDVEDRVVAMEAVVASSKEGGVQGSRSGRPVGMRQGHLLELGPRAALKASELYYSSHRSPTLFSPQHGIPLASGCSQAKIQTASQRSCLTCRHLLALSSSLPHPCSLFQPQGPPP